ncbi:MAG: hypothetical protein ABH851_05760 [Methanobacteriota archaeon]
MNINIIEKKDNPLLERLEVHFEFSFDGATPSFFQVRQEFIKNLKADEKLTVLDGLQQAFGENKAKCYAKVYKTADAMTVEPEFRIKKNFEAKEPEKKDLPKAEPAEASEEKSEDKPEEKSEVKAEEKSEEKPEEKPSEKIEEPKEEKPKEPAESKGESSEEKPTEDNKEAEKKEGE